MKNVDRISDGINEAINGLLHMSRDVFQSSILNESHTKCFFKCYIDFKPYSKW